MPDIKKQLGERIRSFRNSIGLNQIQFSDRIGISNSSLSAIEQGDNLPSLKTLITICETYSLSFDWLLLGDPMKVPPNRPCKTEHEKELLVDELRILQMYRSVTKKERRIVKELLEMIAMQKGK